MFSSDEITQTTDALEPLPRRSNRRNLLTERRNHILQQKHTDALPSLAVEPPGTKFAWRQVVQLREENRRLRFELETQRTRAQHLLSEYSNLKTEFEQELAVVHRGHKQELLQHQNHLQEILAERNHLQKVCLDLEQRLQESSLAFQRAVEEAVQQKVLELATMTEQTPDMVLNQLQQTTQLLASRAKQDGDRHLTEALYLKREVMRISAELDKQRRQLEDERQRLLALQQSARVQAELRQKTLHDRLYSRWKVASIATSLGLLVLLVVLQFVCLALFHLSPTVSITAVLIAPVVICSILALIFVTPATMLKYALRSVPRAKKTK